MKLKPIITHLTDIDFYKLNEEKKQRSFDPKIKVTFPSMLLVPALSVLCTIIKLCGGTGMSWLHVLITYPIVMYFVWCAGYVCLTFLALALIKIVKGAKRDE